MQRPHSNHWNSAFGVLGALGALGALASAPALHGCYASHSAPAHVDDSAITSAVKAKLETNGAAQARDIDVRSEHGVVSLIGTVESDAARAEAERLARSCDGVRDVINYLTIAAQ